MPETSAVPPELWPVVTSIPFPASQTLGSKKVIQKLASKDKELIHHPEQNEAFVLVVQKQELHIAIFTSPCSAPLHLFSVSTSTDKAQQPSSPGTPRRANAVGRASSTLVCVGCKMAAESFIISKEPGCRGGYDRKQSPDQIDLHRTAKHAEALNSIDCLNLKTKCSAPLWVHLPPRKTTARQRDLKAQWLKWPLFIFLQHQVELLSGVVISAGSKGATSD